MARSFEEDFILLTEFAEIRHGPQPKLTIPSGGGTGWFDTTSFSVRVFSADFQQGQSEEFSFSPDTQVLLTEPETGAYAYVHYFALYDIQARGYMRQYCISYITTSPLKLINNFQSLQHDFLEATALYKCGNHFVFEKDLAHYQKDIEYSLGVLGDSGSNTTSTGQVYDSRYEDIPEENVATIKKDGEFISGIIKLLKKEMNTEENSAVHNFISTHSAQTNYNITLDGRTEGNSMFYTTESFVDKCQISAAFEDNKPYIPKRVMAHVYHRFTRQLRPLEVLCNGTHPLAMGVMRRIHKKYSRSDIVLQMEQEEQKLLSPCSSLVTVGRVPITNVLQHTRYNDNINRSLESPVVYRALSHDQLSSSKQNGSELTDNGHALTDSGQIKFETSSILKSECTQELLYLDSVPRQRGSIVDPLSTPYIDSMIVSGSSYNTPRGSPSDEGSLVPPSYDTPPQSNDNIDTLPTEAQLCVAETRPHVEATPPTYLTVPKLDRTSSTPIIESSQSSHTHTIIDNDREMLSMSVGDVRKQHNVPEEDMLSRSLPLYGNKPRPPNLVLVSDTMNLPHYYTPAAPYSPTYDEEYEIRIRNGYNEFPFISSCDLIEHKSPFKPGCNVLSIFKDVLEFRDITYCLLQGRPFVIIAHPKEERLVRKHVQALWAFVGGHTSKNQVIPWQTEPLQLQQLTNTAIVGLSAATLAKTPPFKQHVSYWDWTTHALHTPVYNGSILNPILSRSLPKNEELFLALLESMLSDIGIRVFLYYHGYVAQATNNKPLTPEMPPKKLFSTTQRKDKAYFSTMLGIKDGDLDIIEYFVDLIRKQQLCDWFSHTQTCEDPPKIALNLKYSNERLCKPKRLT